MPDRERAAVQAGANAAADRLELRLRRGLGGGLRRRRGQEDGRVAHHRHPHGDVADAGPEVHQGLSLAVGVEAIHVAGADLQLERGGDAVGGAQGVVLVVLAVRVQVDEARRHHQAAGVDGGPAAQRLRGDGRDPSRGDADVAHGVECRSRDP